MCWRVVGSVSPRVSTRMYPIVGYLGLEQRRRSLRMNINLKILRTGGSAPGDADSGGRAGRLVRCFQVACCGVIEGVRCRGGGGGNQAYAYRLFFQRSNDSPPMCGVGEGQARWVTYQYGACGYTRNSYNSGQPARTQPAYIRERPKTCRNVAETV